MSFGNYADLVASVNTWAARGDTSFGGRVDDFIRLGEERIWRNLRTMDMLSLPTVLTVNAGTNYAALPADWLGFRSAPRGAYPYNSPDYVTPDQLLSLPPSGDKCVFTVLGSRFVVGTTPTVNPSCYLYAAMLEGYLFLKNTAKAQEYRELLSNALDSVSSQSAADEIRGMRLRSRGPFSTTG
jgi:hypothetical protein